LEDLYAQAKEIQSFIDPSKYPSDLDAFDSKNTALAALRILNENLLKEVMNNEELLEQLRQDHPDAEKQAEVTLAGFSVSKTTKQACLEFLKENDVDIDSWINDADESEKVKKALKLFFTLDSAYNKEEWCLFPQVLDDELFWAGAKQTLINDAAQLGRS
jgi:hypothetical protein